jgi:hypothetical protein
MGHDFSIATRALRNSPVTRRKQEPRAAKAIAMAPD